jgi:hypothetical protein
LIARHASWGYTWRRRKIEELADKLLTAAQSLPMSPKKNIELPTVLNEQEIWVP